ncbi:MAG: hypothetical protein J6A30_01885 [Ruminococcus sp.]|nr:hypothetical protein [Ruminococcus sp.]
MIQGMSGSPIIQK